MNNNNFGSSQNEEPKNEAPCLLQNERGVCVLYKERYLYSKYDPSKSIKNIISNLTINPNTLVLIFSPVLWHGLDDLFLKMQTGCQIAAIEYDDQLYKLADSKLKELQNNYSDISSQTYNTNNSNINSLINNIHLYNKNEIKSYLNFINTSHFKKVIRIDFSGGTYFNRDSFEQIYSVTQSVIDQYFKNKLTLIKFGRLFSKNIFKNLKSFDSNTFLLQDFEKTVDKPILVLGAGESLDKTIKELKSEPSDKPNKTITSNTLTSSDTSITSTIRDTFFILAVDQALTPLLENNITPDAVVAVEAQLAIEKAYIGKAVNSGIPLILDLVSRNHIPQITNSKKIFFMSDYSQINFLKSLSDKNILPEVIKPLGSVGLVAAEIALKLRKDKSIPVFVSGLDFSYTAGITHAKGTVAHKRQLSLTSKLKSIFNFNSAFSTSTTATSDKSNNKMITTVALSNYAKLFRDIYSDEENLFDTTVSGLPLGLKQKDFTNQITESTDNLNKRACDFSDKLNSLYFTPEKLKSISKYLSDEKLTLETLKDILTYGNDSKYRKTAGENSTSNTTTSNVDENILSMQTQSLEEQINSLITSREYLYLHFPDTPETTNRQSFLNRIRIETDFFIKEL